MVASMAVIAAVLSVPAMLWATTTTNEFPDAFAYASVSTATALWAMLLRRRGGGGGGGGDTDNAPDTPELPPFDWDDFERRFWEDVKRRGRDRPRVPSGAGT